MHRSRLILSALLLCAGTAAAQPAVPVYDSAFTGYKKHDDAKVADWKASNAAVAASPGHAAHDPHAGHVMPKAATPPAPAKPDPHAEHKH